jgi:PST family polysaccharide transporter
LEKILILFTKIKDLLRNKVWQKLFENFLSLSVLQGLIFLTELITLPYLTQTLGADYYGLISFAISFLAFFQIIAEYGFNHSGTRAISKYRDDKEKLQKIYSSITFVKIILTFVCFGVLLTIVLIFERFRSFAIIYILLFGLIIQSVLFPIWFFRGIERMRYITIIDFVGKVFLILLIFLFINSESDFVLYPLFILMNAIFIGIIAQIFIFMKYKIKLEKTTVKEIKNQFSLGFFMFLVYFSSNVITNLNPFLLGLFVDYRYVGIFTAGYKIIQIFVLIITLITTTVFPHIVKLITESNKKLEANIIKFIKKILLIIILIGLFSLIFLFIFSDLIVRLLFGTEYAETANVIRILSFAPLLIGIGHTIAIQIMIPLEYDSQVAKIYSFAAIIDIILCFIFVPVYGYIALCFIILITRMIPIILASIWVSKNKVLLNLPKFLNRKSFDS